MGHKPVQANSLMKFYDCVGGSLSFNIRLLDVYFFIFFFFIQSIYNIPIDLIDVGECLCLGYQAILESFVLAQCTIFMDINIVN